MAADGGAVGCKTTSCSLRWPCLARCAVALVVGVLAAVILVKAVSLILNPNKFQLSVSSRFLVFRSTKPEVQYTWRFYLQAENRREHASMYYRNVTVSVIDGGAPAGTPDMMKVHLSTVVALMQGEVQEYYFAEVSKLPLSEYYLHALAKDTSITQSIGGCTVRLDGVLTNGAGDRSYPASYICETVTVVNASDTARLPSASDNDAPRCIPTVF